MTAGSEITDPELGRAAARGGVWGVAGEISTRVAQSVVFFSLAEFLSPAQFGAAAVAFFCVQIANALTYAGLGQAVQVLGADPRRDRTALGLGLTLSGAGAIALALLAGPVCAALGARNATHLVQLVALALPLGQTSEVLASLLARDLRFRATGSATIIASVASLTAGLTMAAMGAGAIALVAQSVIQPGARLLLLAAANPSALRPRLHLDEVRHIWRFGRVLLLSALFETMAANVDNICVSAIAGSAALGAYGFGYNLTALPMYVVGLAVSRVALPVYGRLRDRPQMIGPAFQQAVEVTTWLTALPLGYLAIAGPDALQVLFGDKWSAIDDALRLLALHGWLRATETASTSVLIASKQTRTSLTVQVGQFLLAAALLVPLVSWHGPLGAALAIVLAVTAGTTYSLSRSTSRTGASRLQVLSRMVEGAVAGTAGGTAGWLLLRHGHGYAQLVGSLLLAVLTWLVCLVLLRRRTVLLAVEVLGRRSAKA